MRVGIIDCGTNTVRLFIAESVSRSQPDPERPAMTDVLRVLRFVRLGQGVDATRHFHPDALARTFAALDEFADLIEHHGPLDALRFIATSAARDADNREAFFDGVRARLGVTPEVISGDEEARLSFLGALAGGPVPLGTLLVVDIGGGSTEVIVGDHTGQVQAEHSFDMGSVRLRERFLLDDPPTSAQIDAARRFVAGLLDERPDLLPTPAKTTTPATVDGFNGVAGTNTSLSAMHLGLTTYDATRVHNSSLTPSTVHALAEHLLAVSVADIKAEYPILEPLRAEVICAGALICDVIAARAGQSMIVRETDILDGAALSLLRDLAGVHTPLS
jgi:exopolyphosphatase/guanosine-5'-triphosphate,3'-diphosphate pyrophosphatase